MSDTISPKERKEADQFYMALGRAIARWGAVEHALANILVAITQLPPEHAIRLFRSARSFQGRYDMLAAVAETVTGPPREQEVIKAILAKASTYSQTRNALAHDPVAFSIPLSVDEPRQLVIREPFSSELLSLEGVNNARSNFGLLLAVISARFTPTNDPQIAAPERLLGLLAQLPKRAHDARIHPNLEGQFRLGLIPQPFPT